MANEVQTIADILHNTRGLTRWYLKKLSDEQMMVQPVLDGKTYNSAYWIMAHLCWADSFLLLKGTGGEMPDISWLNRFRIGAAGTSPGAEDPHLDVVREAFREIREKALEHVRSIDPASLDQSSGLPMFETRRIALYHAIRHEGTHCGHLGWLCKMHGIATV